MSTKALIPEPDRLAATSQTSAIHPPVRPHPRPHPPAATSPGLDHRLRVGGTLHRSQPAEKRIVYDPQLAGLGLALGQELDREPIAATQVAPVLALDFEAPVSGSRPDLTDDRPTMFANKRYGF